MRIAPSFQRSLDRIEVHTQECWLFLTHLINAQEDKGNTPVVYARAVRGHKLCVEGVGEDFVVEIYKLQLLRNRLSH